MAGRRCLVSTIITTHNRPRLVVLTLDSLRRQTYRPIEVLIVDDGSQDATAKAIAGWQSTHQHDPEFKLDYRWQKNQGPAGARNVGVQNSSGELIHFLDDDDLLHRRALAQLVSALPPEADAAVAMASYQRWANGTPAGAVHYPPPVARRQLLRLMIAGKWFVPVHGYLFTRTALARIGAWTSALTSQEDDEFLLRAAMAGMVFRCAPRARVYYREHRGIRRSVPGKPGETLDQGTVDRMTDDLAIRESVFKVLTRDGASPQYRSDFMAWQTRFQQRYAYQWPKHEPESPLLDWLGLPQRLRERGTAPLHPRKEQHLPAEPDTAAWRLA